MKKEKHNKPNDTINLEDFLLENNFELVTYYGTNKRYRKEITNCQTLYVRIFSDVNKIVDVEYEDRGLTKFENTSIISFETIETIEQLTLLIEALKIKIYTMKNDKNLNEVVEYQSTEK